MASAQENHITFRLLYNLPFQTAIYIVIDSEQYCSVPIRMICNHRNRNGGFHDIWETQHLYFSQLLPLEQKISYYYFRADFRDPTENRQDIKWQGQNQRMGLQFNREIYHKSFVIIQDRCDQKLMKMNQLGQPFRYMDKRIMRQSMEKTIIQRISLITEIPLGQWIFAMLLPTQMQNGIDEAGLMNAIRAKRTASKKRPNVSFWSIKWAFNLQELQKLGDGSINFAFFESYYYHRIKSQWKAIIRNEDGTNMTGNLQKIAEMLQKQNIQYVIQSDYQQDQNQIPNIQNWSQDFIKTKVTYECTDDIDPKKVFAVYLISSMIPQQKLTRNKNNPKIWEANIYIEADLLQNLDYHFEVKMLKEVEQSMEKQNITKATHTQKITNYRPGNRIMINCNRPLTIIKSQSHNKWVNSRDPYEEYYRGGSQSSVYSASSCYLPSNFRYAPYIPNYYRGHNSSSNVYRSSKNSIQTKSSQQRKQKTIKIFDKTKNIIQKVNYSQNNNKNPQIITNYVERISRAVSSFGAIEKDIDLLSQRSTYLKERITKDNNFILPKNLKKLLAPVKLKLIRKSQIQQIIDDLKKQKQALQSNYPSLSEKFQKIQQKTIQQQFLQDKIYQNKLRVFNIEIITAVKQWGKSGLNTQYGDKIVQIIQRYHSLPDKESIITICYYVNYFMTEVHRYHIKAPHNSSCQKNMQRKWVTDFSQYLHMNKGMQYVKNNQLYQYLIQCVNFPFQQLRIFGSNHSIHLQSSQQSILLMRTLINYAIVYNLMRKYEQSFPNFSYQGCGQLGPYCRQQKTYSTTLQLITLKALRDKYLSQNQIHSQQIQTNEGQLVEIEKQCINQIEDITKKRLAGLVNLQYDLQNISKQLEQNGKTQIIFNTLLKPQKQYEDLLDEYQQLQKQEQQAYKIERQSKGANVIDIQDKKLSKARDILNHQYLQNIAKIS